MIKVLFLALLALTGTAAAHEMTPTYPVLGPSYVNGLFSAQLTLFNARKDVDYYEIGVFDEAGNPIPFAATSKLLKVTYGSRRTFEVFVRKEDRRRAVFICSLSKLRTDSSARAIISSKICSRTKGTVP